MKSIVDFTNEIKAYFATKQALTNVENDNTSIRVTGSTNNTGGIIHTGTFFYLNGSLVSAKAPIANGATLTSGTNYDPVIAGGLNALIGNTWKTLFSGTQAISSAHEFSIDDLQKYKFLSIRGYQTSNSGGKRFHLSIADCTAASSEYNYVAYGDDAVLQIRAMFLYDKVTLSAVQSDVYVTEIKGLL